MQAALAASREIGFTIVSMTISLVAVFIPVLFLSGIVGRLLHEFAVTIVVAILISGFVSLTLTPMLGSRFLKSEHEARHGVFYHLLEGGFNLLARWYEVTLRIAMRFHPVTMLVAVAMLVGTVYLFVTMPTGFIPSQDSGFTFGVVVGPQDMSFDSMAQHLRQVADDPPAPIPTWHGGRHWRRRRGPKQPGLRVRQLEAARPAGALRGPDHRRAAARNSWPSRACSHSCRTRRPSTSAASSAPASTSSRCRAPGWRTSTPGVRN